MPTRRERLRALMELRSQRRWMIGAIGALGLVTAGLAGVLLDRSAQPRAAALGTASVSVEAMRPAAIAAQRPIAGGEASYYGAELAGQRTAAGERFDPEARTAAHRTLPLGSRVQVTNPDNGKSVIVRINDRGPFHGDRVIDLSLGAAREIGLVRSGVGEVRMALLLD
jgi:rare lipoprotein A (peptidoglycan hydrolase)